MQDVIYRWSGIATCSYGPCTRVLPSPRAIVVVAGVAYCSQACADADRKPSPFYRRMGGDWSW